MAWFCHAVCLQGKNGTVVENYIDSFICSYTYIYAILVCTIKNTLIIIMSAVVCAEMCHIVCTYPFKFTIFKFATEISACVFHELKLTLL